MPMAAGATDRGRQLVVPAVVPAAPTAVTVTDAIAKDAVLAWFRGEFAAANAIIDALCGHLGQVSSESGSEYEAVFAAIHRRRLNWIPVLQMQKYHPIADVAVELKKVTAKKKQEKGDAAGEGDVQMVEEEEEKMNEEEENGGEMCLDEKEFGEEKAKIEEMPMENNEIDGGRNEALAPIEEEDSIGSEITDSGKYNFALSLNQSMKFSFNSLIKFDFS